MCFILLFTLLRSVAFLIIFLGIVENVFLVDKSWITQNVVFLVFLECCGYKNFTYPNGKKIEDKTN